VNSAGDEFYPRQISRSLGAVNSGPVSGPLVISEIHYNPEADGYEFVEVLNITGNPVPLFSTGFPTNTWRFSGIDYSFPTNMTLVANSTVLVSATNAALFRARYNVPEGVAVLGPFSGQLQNSGENLELQAPDAPNPEGVPYVTIDAVRYNDRNPWPPAADGSGLSLQRAPASGYGSEPLNWIAAAPTPGNVSGTGDTDGDGMNDEWEQEHGTFVFIPDADEDPDKDGLTNREEFMAGTHPNSASNVLRFEHVSISGGAVYLQFNAAANRTYSLLYKSALADTQWLKAADVLAQAAPRVVSITNSVPAGAQRFYRIVTPAQN